MNLLRTMPTFSWSCRAFASVVILSNNNTSLQFSLVQRTHGAQYFLNLFLIFESYSYREMRHNSLYRTKSLHMLIYIYI